MPTLLALLTGAVLAAAAPAPDALPSIPFQQFRLPNGLNVILSEDHTTPLVGVEVLYDVGSKDEKPGRTGFAHLFEHLMFQGTANLPKGEADRLIDAAGGSSNGSTSTDRTQYWEQVPSNALEQMLFIQSERMGHLLPTLDQQKLDNQREVVRNERRENYEMRPYGQAWKAILENLWNPEFPYHWQTIGSHEDLQAASLADVKEFFQRWYGPGNASLAIVGDIDPVRTRALVEKYFGSIPRADPPRREVAPPVPLSSERKVEIEDDVQLPRLYLAWQSPRDHADGDAELEALGDILSNGKSSRLQRRLVMEERVAQSVMAGQQSQALAGMFLVVVTPKPGVPVERLRAAVDEEIARIAKEGPTEQELQRAKNRIESAVVFGLEPVGGFGGRAAMLNSYYWETGDPGYLGKDLARFRSITAEGVREAAARWLANERRVSLVVKPRAKATPGAPAPVATPAGEDE
ncbi:MAG TPA: pitrilysin family protein [Anaeromyxobacteraceae bacterium]|nr:pitrilysin family protein [Anaeromyxobacteraceae bacterium]